MTTLKCYYDVDNKIKEKRIILNMTGTFTDGL